MLKRKDLQNIWEDLVKKGSINYNSLTREERVWFNLEPLANSGIIDHYTNYGAEKNSDVLEDLKYLKLDEIHNLLLEINNLFLKKTPPIDIDLRNDEIYNWTDEKKGLFEKNESLFWDKVLLLENAILKHINNNIKES